MNLTCPSDAYAGLQAHTRFSGSGCPDGSIIAGPSATSFSMGQSYARCGGPVTPAGAPDPQNIAFNPAGFNSQPGINCGEQGTGSPGMFAAGYVAYRIRDCTDGTSKTFLLGEQLPAISLHQMMFHSHQIVGHGLLSAELSPHLAERDVQRNADDRHPQSGELSIQQQHRCS